MVAVDAAGALAAAFWDQAWTMISIPTIGLDLDSVRILLGLSMTAPHGSCPSSMPLICHHFASAKIAVVKGHIQNETSSFSYVADFMNQAFQSQFARATRDPKI